MRLGDLLQSIPNVQWDKGEADRNVELISCDSREPQSNSLFVALSGAKFNGEDFIKDALHNGAWVVAKATAGRQLSGFQIPPDVAVLQTPDPKQFLREAAQRFYGNPSTNVGAIGITGTNGKTTITYLLESIIQTNAQTCGVIGTVNYRIAGQVLPSKNTTPGYLENQRHLAHMASEGVPWCVMEVSSHALQQGRVDGIDFRAAIFTNLTQDHLDYHHTMEEYFLAKSLLFTNLSTQARSVINIDDAYGQRLTAMSRGQVTTYGIKQPADVRASHITYELSGTRMTVNCRGEEFLLHTALIGEHNVYNILAACACAYALGFSVDVIRRGIEQLKHVPGRLEAVRAGQKYFVFIDYAHTEDGLVNVLKALRTVSPNKMIVVFGCGGDRDAGKRPKMGRAVSELADYAVVTSDNPRSEDPQAIIDQILGGFTRKNFEVCVDRREAIGRALNMAKPGEVVLLAGKGHEDYQILKDKIIPFDERVIVREMLGRV